MNQTSFDTEYAALSSMPQPWDASLQRLLLDGVLSGFALVSHTGENVGSYGALFDGPVAVQQLQSLFQTGAAKQALPPAPPGSRHRLSATALLSPDFPCSGPWPIAAY